MPVSKIIASIPANCADKDLASAAVFFMQANAIYIDVTTIKKSILDVNSYYPRIWRGFAYVNGVSYSPHKGTKYDEYRSKIQCVSAASSLFAEFLEVFRYVDPHTSNYNTFGVRIRELLILACTEIEANWRGVLEAHGIKPRRKYFNTEDYSRLIDPLHLPEWGVVVKYQPGLGAVKPFEFWSASNSTQSIPWYEAYNLVKHDRLGNMEYANFFNLYSAIAALFIMQVAQWGVSAFEDMELKSPFTVTSLPSFSFDDMPVSDTSGNPSIAQIHTKF